MRFRQHPFQGMLLRPIKLLDNDSGSSLPMQNKPLLPVLGFTAVLALAGCSVPGVYKLDIQQGNVITQDMVDQLRPGMTAQQVRFIMGTPLISDTFNPQRWDYLYSLEPGRQQRRQERLTLLFDEQGRLSGLQGDFRPGVSKDEEILGENSTAPDSQLPD